MAHQLAPNPGFKTVRLLKDQTLGIGSYGKVCKAKCDDLLCAAKLIHETLFDPNAQQLIAPQREHRLPMRRFEQECEFLSTIRHPNIVQYLGIYRDPDTGLPALLMELMDNSLTHFLESSPQPIPYHIQVNICHDVTLALSFLHSNSIIHRDLSSNNVLLIGNVRAKVTDFGMARLSDQDPQATQFTFTMCPGTDVYMPPEAVQEEPVYTEKIDCFSFGVIAIQILSQRFPKPGNRKKRVPVSLPDLPSDTIAEVPIPEIERRQNHISTIGPNHPLRPIVLDSLKDKDVERPSAQQLCERVASLKEGPQYSESVKAVETRSIADQGSSDERDRQLRSLSQQHSQQVLGLQQIINEKDQALRQKDETIAAGQQQLRQLERVKNQAMEEKERELIQKMGEISRLNKEKNHAIEEARSLDRWLGCVNQQLEESQQVIAQFQRRITELEQQNIAIKEQSSIKLTWRDGEKAPYVISNISKSATDGNTLYIRLIDNRSIYAYTISTSQCSQLPDSPTNYCPSVIINNLLTLIGGYVGGYVGAITTNQLFSLTGEGRSRRWTEEFPPMPTKRRDSTALCTGTALIVAGGWTASTLWLKTVEVMNTATKQWSTAADLPQPLSYYAQAAVCGDQIYILGKSDMYTCSLDFLIQSCKSFLASIRNWGVRIWKEAVAPPVIDTTCVSVHGQLLAIGGKDSDEEPTTAVHIYYPTTDFWEVISHMGTPRRECIATVLPNNQLMVVGGRTGKDHNTETDSVEFATIE